MTTSFADVLRLMEPTESIGLRELSHRHRWLGGPPPQPISLRAILDRHDQPGVGHHRFLTYNTFLLAGFEVSLCNVALLAALAGYSSLDPRWIVKELGLSPQDIVNRLDISVGELVNDLGIPESAIRSAFSSVVSDFVNVITGGAVDLDDILGELSPSNILNTFDVTVDQIMDHVRSAIDIMHGFCQESLEVIASVSGLPIDGTIFRIAGKAEREERAREIGAMLGTDYDIVALCEVTNDDDLGRIKGNIANSGRSVQFRQGPGPQGNLANSGLVALGMDRGIVESSVFEFSERGDVVRDADHWANKGVLRTVYDIGIGRLEVYNTHLFAGGELIGSSPSSGDRLAIQMSQLSDLVSFYRSTHDPANVAIVCGDFNMWAEDATVYGSLVAALHNQNLALLDAWPFHHHRTPAAGDHDNNMRGDTAADDDGSSQLDKVCHETPDGRFCNDALIGPKETKRIDYIFVENPRPEHTYMLDITRLRRRPFRRQGQNLEEKWMSDHLGVDTLLIASPL